jgi:hypothetical protein
MNVILDSLIFDNVVVWDNSIKPDWKCAGRYMAALRCHTSYVYWQDDDVLVSPAVQRELLRQWDNSEPIVANYGHGENDGGYGDLPLVCGGAVARWRDAWGCIARYGAVHPLDEAFMYEADFVVGVLYPSFKHIHEPFEINMPIAQHSSRLCNQEWQFDLKLEITNRARAIRDARTSPRRPGAGQK